MSRKLYKNQNGFTIIELLIATVVFSVLLLVMLTAFIRTGDLFYKGVSMSKTQEDARNVVKSLSDDIQFTKTAPQSGAGVYCIGIHRYQYQLGVQVNGGNYGIRRDNQGNSSCSPAARCGAGCTNLLDAGMQVNKFKIDCDNGLCKINIHLVFYGGDPSQMFTGSTTPYFKASDAQCKGSLSDTRLCAAVDYDSTVLEST